MSLLSQPLSLTQLRVLGALIEKEITTPEYYPLSLNALINACNQRSSRDPILDLFQNDVLSALDGLEALYLTASVHDARVTKYEHRVRTVLSLRRDETALLCLLLLRGPQTPGELRSRADRLYAFDDLSAVTATLDRLAARPAPESLGSEASSQPLTGPLTVLLPRQTGAREARYAHLLGAVTEAASPAAPVRPPAVQDVGSLETMVSALVEKVGALESRVAQLEAAARPEAQTNPS